MGSIFGCVAYSSFADRKVNRKKSFDAFDSIKLFLLSVVSVEDEDDRGDRASKTPLPTLLRSGTNSERRLALVFVGVEGLDC